MKKASNLAKLATEQANPASENLDTKSAIEIARIINSEDARVAAAVARALPQIASAIEWIAEALAGGGRLIYVGTGTSGRIAALDAAECPPTFGIDPKLVQFVMAGGNKALGAAIEADEDSRIMGAREIRKKRPGKKDIVVGVSASGRTPFTIAAVSWARRAGAKTVAVTCNPRSRLAAAADLAIVGETGAEVVAGSTRMKAGTAEKMVLNMLSTGAMVRLGFVYGNLMVNLHQKNRKLEERAVGIVENVTRVHRGRARRLLKTAGNSVPVAIVMQSAGVSKRAAEAALGAAFGHVREAIKLAGQ